MNTAIIETLKKASVFTESRRTYPILKYARMNGMIEATNIALEQKETPKKFFRSVLLGFPTH